MSNAETHTVDTVYGPAEIETYECDSCGNRVAYENTVGFTIGGSEGRACEHCEENGPISFPKRVVEFSWPKDQESMGEEYGIVFNTVLAPLLFLFIIADAFTEERDAFAEGYATAIVSVLVWIGIPLLLWVVV